MKELITALADLELKTLETKMLSEDKHLISTRTLRDRIERQVDLSDENRDREYLMTIGLGQVMQSRLYVNGYRSVRTGYFVNLDKCDNVPYLYALLQNEDLQIAEKTVVKKKIEALMKKKRDPQCSLIFDGSEIVGISNPPTEDEVIEMVEQDAV